MTVTEFMAGRVRRRLERVARRVRAAYRRRARPTVIRHHGIELPLGDGVSDAMREVLYRGTYEEREYQVLSALLRPGDRVLELGSGLGFITVLCARLCGSDAVVTVEANPRMHGALAATFRRNRVSPTLLSGVVSRTAEPQPFFVNANFWSSSTYDRGGQRLEVGSLAFTDLVAAHRPSVIVIDIEGGEVALIGLPVAPNVRMIVLELHAAVTGDSNAEAVRAWLIQEGFRATTDWGNHSVVVFERPRRSV